MAGCKISELSLLGENEPFYRIKYASTYARDFIFYFTSGKKQGYTNEHSFNNRALSFVFGLEGKVVTIFQGYEREMYEEMHHSKRSINSGCFGLFGEEEYRRVVASYSEEGRRAKRNAGAKDN